MTPELEEIMLNYQYSLLSGSLLNVDDEAEIVDDGDIIDVGGILDPDARSFDLDDEDISNFE